MTHTIITPNGCNAVWVEADYGQGRRGRARLVTWRKIGLREYLETVDLIGMSEDQACAVKDELLVFEGRAHAWIAEDSDESKMFVCESDARAWAHSRKC